LLGAAPNTKIQEKQNKCAFNSKIKKSPERTFHYFGKVAHISHRILSYKEILLTLKTDFSQPSLFESGTTVTGF
jgi:hypothetical protein